MNKSSFQLFFLVQIGLKTCQTNFKYVYVLQYAQVYMFKYTVCSSACAELHNGIGIYGSFTKNIRLIFLMKNGVLYKISKYFSNSKIFNYWLFDENQNFAHFGCKKTLYKKANQPKSTCKTSLVYLLCCRHFPNH